MHDDKVDPHRERTPTGDLDAALPESPAIPADRSEATAESARAAGLEPGGATPAGEQDRTVTGELDRAVNAPDHSVTRDREEAALPVRGRS
jgi:hypothetical protein